MAVIKTIIKVPTLDAQYVVPGEWTQATVVSSYGASLQGIGSMTATSSDDVTPEGTVRTLTFSPRVGNKG